jgi:hypothetical protein
MNEQTKIREDEIVLAVNPIHSRAPFPNKKTGCKTKNSLQPVEHTKFLCLATKLCVSAFRQIC